MRTSALSPDLTRRSRALRVGACATFALSLVGTVSLAAAEDAGAPDAGDRKLRVTPEALGLKRRPDDAGVSSYAPDPPPLVTSEDWVFDLKWDRGEVSLLGVKRVKKEKPEATPRVMGRFALELFEGPTLVERVRFDFPGLGAPLLDPADAGIFPTPSLDTKLTTRIGVKFPATRRGTRLELWDRATDRRYPLPWPPEP
ncbi:MAG: hypothetical protein U0169_20610 [Polyangiaceae bacterium]